MKSSLTALLLIAAVSLSGCYHTKVTTGLTPSGQKIEIPFALSFVYGLVPPAEVKTAADCPNGVAIVESQISILNGLVAALTFSLVTPMNITVTCAAASTAALPTENPVILAKASATDAEHVATVSEAADMARNIDGPVYIVYE
jgi:hypothetical protein